MDIERCKRGREHDPSFEERDDEQGQYLTAATDSALSFCILELPTYLLYDILSRLPPKTIFFCKCVCKTFLKIFTDPYFAEIHLTKAPNGAASIVLQDFSVPSEFRFFYMLDLEETSSSSSSYNNHHPPFRRPRRSGLSKSLTVRNTKFLFCSGRVTLVGSCNGLLCLRSDLRPLPLYYICNPVLGELVVLPPLSFFVNYSGFGFCPKTKQYKVICFICFSCTDPMTNVLSTKAVAEICTLGTESWRRIGDAPCPLLGGSFDSFLNGNLHWLTNSVSASNRICSFDFESEQFRSVPSPTHFDPVYVHKISWINVGVLGGQLCLCYIIGDAEFDVWVMKDYGVESSWTREFVIDIKFYCGLNVDNLNHPIRFLNNGDLLFISDSKSIVSYSPRKGTFKNFKALGTQNIQAITHIPSFVSLKDMARGKTVKLDKWRTGEGMHIYITTYLHN
ncbi:hypothetical protein Acr_09g0008360 [Actinidia rufa]|uniref:F-box domain-containing protein n=1 Tax=Actinidia rufa TaxID=165716 RepID=A0A7J0F6T6_9ERIC|nr:hypothetical protein Acr_09g0008360 [Actinidia rufa]